MSSLFTLLFAFLAFSSIALGQSTKSTVLCTTLLGATPKTPAPSKTIAVTVTTTTTSTSTFTNTKTVTTTITVTPTTTIATSPGFTPAASQTNNPQGPGLYGRKMARRELEPRAFPRTRCSAGPNGKPTFTPALYPTQVLCGALIKVIKTTTKTFTASTTATVVGTPVPPNSITTTFSTATTQTLTPIDASTTETLSITQPILITDYATSTAYATTTATETVEAPTATYYAACGAANQLSTVEGKGITSFGTSNTASYVTGITTGYDCCVACITSPATCGAAALFVPSSTCVLVTPRNNMCDPKMQVLEFFTQSGFPQQAVISTGNCGAVFYNRAIS
ncbi:MAG: hypothetical protein Q9182_002820 [Xanthomendoza sp. 2 TL-2023]